MAFLVYSCHDEHTICKRYRVYAADEHPDLAWGYPVPVVTYTTVETFGLTRRELPSRITCEECPPYPYCPHVLAVWALERGTEEDPPMGVVHLADLDTGNLRIFAVTHDATGGRPSVTVEVRTGRSGTFALCNGCRSTSCPHTAVVSRYVVTAPAPVSLPKGATSAEITCDATSPYPRPHAADWTAILDLAPAWCPECEHTHRWILARREESLPVAGPDGTPITVTQQVLLAVCSGCWAPIDHAPLDEPSLANTRQIADLLGRVRRAEGRIAVLEETTEEAVEASHMADATAARCLIALRAIRILVERADPEQPRPATTGQ